MPTKPGFRTVVAQILLLRILWPLPALLRALTEDEDSVKHENAVRFMFVLSGMVAPYTILVELFNPNPIISVSIYHLVLSVLLYTTLCFIYGVFEKQLGGKPYQLYQDEEK